MPWGLACGITARPARTFPGGGVRGWICTGTPHAGFARPARPSQAEHRRQESRIPHPSPVPVTQPSPASQAKSALSGINYQFQLPTPEPPLFPRSQVPAWECLGITHAGSPPVRPGLSAGEPQIAPRPMGRSTLAGRTPSMSRRHQTTETEFDRSPPRTPSGLPLEGYLPAPAGAALRAACGRLSHSVRFAPLHSPDSCIPKAPSRTRGRTGGIPIEAPATCVPGVTPGTRNQEQRTKNMPHLVSTPSAPPLTPSSGRQEPRTGLI